MRPLFLLCTVLVLALAGPLQAQPPPEPPPAPPLVTQVRLTGDLPFDQALLHLQLRTRPNRRFLGIPGARLWLWLYNLGNGGCCFSDRFRGALIGSGEPPALLDRTVVADDQERLRQFYQSEGYREAQVSTRIDTLNAEASQVRVVFDVNAGPATYLRTIRYEGLEELTPAQRETLLQGSALRPGPWTDRQPVAFTARNQRYSESRLLEERRYILTFLRNEGYARVSRDSIRARIHAPRPDSFDVVFRIGTGPRMRFGAISLDVQGPERTPTRVDTLRPRTPETPGFALSTITNESKLKPRALASALQFWPGQWFSQARLTETKQRLENIGLFTFTDFVPAWPAAADTLPRVPYRVELRTRPRHQVRFESFMLQRTAVLGDETGTGEVGLGGGVAYKNANLLGSGERFQIRGSTSFAADLEGGLFNTAQTEIETSVLFPYLIWPFRSLGRSLNLYEARSRLSLSVLQARRASLLLTIRGRGSLQAGLEMRHSPTLSSLVSLLDFDLSDPDTLSGFSQRFLSGIQDPVERERILEDYSRPQVNNALRYALRSTNTNLFRRDRGHVREVSFEIGGNLPYVLDRFAFTPGIVEGSLPGLGVRRLVYRQYLRMLLDVRRYKPVASRTVFAWKVIGGWAHPTGRSRVVPFDRRFYSGGAVSVRGWNLRALGPGSIPQRNRESLIQGGDIKFEVSVESRNTILRNVFKADWIMAFFADAGNTWYGPRHPGDARGVFQVPDLARELGVGSGVGLRIAWQYLILRLDVAFPLRDPAAGFFAEDAFNPKLHFGIGQAF